MAWGDAGQILTRLQTDQRRNKPKADLVFGFDQQTWPTLRPFVEDWGSWQPENYSKVRKELKIENGFVPLDYSHLGIMANFETYYGPRKISLWDLTSPKKTGGERNLILQDPRTSTPGLSFLLFSHAVLGKDFSLFWEKLTKNWLTLSPSWSSAFQLFSKQEAHLVWTYFTSQAYVEENEPSARYQMLEFEEGQPLQIEGVAAIKNSSTDPLRRKVIRQFLDFVLSKEAQALIPRHNWMFPVRSDVILPPSFSKLPKPQKTVSVDVDPRNVEKTLDVWARSIQK